jgi:hypothetical protein
MTNRIDRNANNDKRQQRAFQRLRTSTLTGSVSVTAPLSNSGSTISLTLGGSGGLVTTTGTLGIKLNTNSGLALAAGGLSFATLTTKGDILTFSTVLARLGVGSNGQMLTAQSAQTTGLQWANASPLTTKGDLYGFNTANARIAVGADNTVLTADSTNALGVKWATPATNITTTKGDLSGFSTVAARIPIGTDGQHLIADSTQTLGLRWGVPLRNLASDPGSPAVGDAWLNTTSGDVKAQATIGTESLVGMIGNPLQATTNSDNVGASSTTESFMAISGTNVKYTIPANTLKAGQVLRIFVGGRFNAAVLETVQWRIRVGGTSGATIYDSQQAATNSFNGSNIVGSFMVLLRMITVGAAGTSRSFGHGLAGVNAAPYLAAPPSIDTTVANDIVISITFGSSNASNLGFLSQFTVENMGVGT